MTNTICRICEKFFDKDGKLECPECYKKDVEDYKTVREYIINHRNVSAMDVNAATGVSIKAILRFINDERIELAEEKQGIFSDKSNLKIHTLK